jgi:hypothetical protein
MKPKRFNGVNVTYAEDQPEYQPLPVQRFPDGEVISCWELSEQEIETITKNKCFYIKVSTFNTPLQPILPLAELSDDIELKYE